MCCAPLIEGKESVITMYIPLQFRLTFFFVLLLALALWFFGSIVYTQAAQQAYSDLDATLSSRAASVQLGKYFLNSSALPAVLPGIAGAGSQGVAIEVLDNKLHLLATTDSNPANFEQPSIAGDNQSPVPWDTSAARSILRHPFASDGTPISMYSTITYQGQRTRVYTMANDDFGSVHIIQTARSEHDIEQSLSNLYRVLLSGGLLVLLFAAVGGWLITLGVLMRVRRITRTARDISKAQSFNRRVADRTWLLQYPKADHCKTETTPPLTRASIQRKAEKVKRLAPGRDELSQLAQTFNEMLDNLERLYRYQQRFVADASHELRAPITSIRCNLDLLASAPDLAPAEAQAALVDARAEADRMGRLVNDLLTLARADAIAGPQPEHPISTGYKKSQPVDLDSLLLEVFRQYRPTGNEVSQQPRLLLSHITPTQVAGDADRLKQAVVALVDNALKYTPPEGSVSLSLAVNDAWAVIEVRDTGIGIAPSDQPHIFERFYRADLARSRDQDSSGLGLAIAQSIVQEHRGIITVESTPGEGSTFTLRLPLNET